VPEAESLESSVASEEFLELEEEMALESEATADMAYEASALTSISREQLPEFVNELLAQTGFRTLIGSVCSINEGELLTDAELDGQLVSIVRDITVTTVVAINLSTCEVIAEVTPNDE